MCPSLPVGGAPPHSPGHLFPPHHPVSVPYGLGAPSSPPYGGPLPTLSPPLAPVTWAGFPLPRPGASSPGARPAGRSLPGTPPTPGGGERWAERCASCGGSRAPDRGPRTPDRGVRAALPGTRFRGLRSCPAGRRRRWLGAVFSAECWRSGVAPGAGAWSLRGSPECPSAARCVPPVLGKPVNEAACVHCASGPFPLGTLR